MRTPLDTTSGAAPRRVLAAFFCFATLGSACGSASEDAGSAGGEPANGVGTTTTSQGQGGAPPEKELESTYGAPVATGSYVWIPNPTSGRVAYIDAATLEVRLVDAGNGPTHLAPIPATGADVAIVLNVLSYDATLLRAEGGALSALSLPVPSGGNTWSISPDGRWAIAWTDARREASASAADGFQDLTVLDLTPGAERSTALAVGYRPVAVVFDDEVSKAFAITQDGVGVLTLDGDEPVVQKNVPLSDDPLEDTTTRDVAVTPDGQFALVRRDGQATIGVFSLADDTRTDVSLPAAATDLDLSGDGKVAVVVMRDTSQVALLPIPGIAAYPSTYGLVSVPDAVVGSAVLPSASPLALLYTNGIASPLLTTLDTSEASPQPHTLKLHAPVLAVFPAADADSAVVLHDALLGDDGTEAYPAALSLVPLSLGLPSKIVGLDAPVAAVALSPSGDRALVAAGVEGGTTHRLYLASLPSLQVESYELASPPISAGIVAGAGKAFVAQKHPDGRITFVDFETGEPRTITGFELAAHIVDGSKP